MSCRVCGLVVLRGEMILLNTRFRDFSSSLDLSHAMQVEQKVSMTWVQPRVLDRNQINIMHNRLGQWCKDVRSMEFLLEDKAKEILT